MYKEFFGLRANPFNVNPDPRYLFLTRHTEEALACLTYGIQSRKGFVLLTGEVGTGKTTLINKLLEWLRLQQVATAFVFNSRMNGPISAHGRASWCLTLATFDRAGSAAARLPRHAAGLAPSRQSCAWA